MRVRILGCSGGIGGRHLRTTSMLIDNDILIDAGTGVGDLSLVELARIDHVFITHSHLDHVACLPLLVDTVGDMRGGDRPLTVYSQQATIDILRNHVFNWSVWPDFTEIPNPECPYLRFEAIELGQEKRFGERSVTALPANHTVPAVGYHLDSGNASLAFSGDTTICDNFWHAVNKIGNLRYLIIETAFSDREKQLAIMSKHLCPSMLVTELEKLQRSAEIFITHLKSDQIELTMHELEELIGEFHPRMLQNNHVFEF